MFGKGDEKDDIHQAQVMLCCSRRRRKTEQRVAMSEEIAISLTKAVVLIVYIYSMIRFVISFVLLIPDT